MADDEDKDDDDEAYVAVPGFVIPFRRVLDADERLENPDGSRTGSMFWTIGGGTFKHEGVTGEMAATSGISVVITVGDPCKDGSQYLVDVRDMIIAAVAAHRVRVSKKLIEDVYHYFQCLNADCDERAVVDVRSRARRAICAMACPFCGKLMDYGGQAAADADGYDTRKVKSK